MSADPDERFNEACPPRPPTDDEYAELQAEHLAAADLDPNWPAVYE